MRDRQADAVQGTVDFVKRSDDIAVDAIIAIGHRLRLRPGFGERLEGRFFVVSLGEDILPA